MTVSIYSPDATAALITHHAKLFVDDGVRTLLITMNGRRDILEAVICALEDERGSCARLASKTPPDSGWATEQAAFDAIIAFLRTMRPTETQAQPKEGVSAC